MVFGDTKLPGILLLTIIPYGSDFTNAVAIAGVNDSSLLFKL